MIAALFLLAVLLFLMLPLAGLALWAVVSTAIVGLVVGGLGRLVVPGRQSIGLLATALLGLVGAITGSSIGFWLHFGRLGTVLVEIAVAAVLVALVSAAGRGRLPRGGRRQPLPSDW